MYYSRNKSFPEVYLFPFQSSFVGAIAIGDLVKSTLGPKGMVRQLHALSSLPVNLIVTVRFQAVFSILRLIGQDSFKYWERQLCNSYQ